MLSQTRFQPLARSIRGSEWTVAIVLAYVALLAGPPLLMLLVIGAKFQGLRDVTALDHAQLARHLAAGDGMITSFVRPLALAFTPELRHLPDLYNAPAHPLLLAVAFHFFEPSDRVAAFTGVVVWIFSVWLLFFLARSWFGAPTAALAALLYAGNVAAVQAATGGLAYPLAAVLVLAAVWLAFPNPAVPETFEEEEEPGPVDEDVGYFEADDEEGDPLPLLSPARLVLAGLFASLAALTHYLLLAVLLALGLWILASQPRRWRAFGLYLLGALLPAAPWMWRSFRLTKWPFFALYWYEFLADTTTYPGNSTWRLTFLPDTPVRFVFNHPLQTARKLMTGLVEFRRGGPDVLDLPVLFLSLAAFFTPAESRRWRGLLLVVWGSLLVAVLGACALQPEPALLLAWVPLLCLIAARTLTGWAEARIHTFELRRRLVADYWARGAIYVLAVIAAFFPLAFYILVARPGPDQQVAMRLEPLKRVLPPDATVITDQPWLVAWYAGRRAVWLPQREEDLAAIERAFGPVDASYVTSGIARVPVEERGDWWIWLTETQGIYRGLEPARITTQEAILRLRTARGGR